MQGLRNLLRHLGARPGGPAHFVVSDLREELVVYINGWPYLRRELEMPAAALHHAGMCSAAQHLSCSPAMHFRAAFSCGHAVSEHAGRQVALHNLGCSTGWKRACMLVMSVKACQITKWPQNFRDRFWDFSLLLKPAR